MTADNLGERYFVTSKSGDNAADAHLIRERKAALSDGALLTLENMEQYRAVLI